MAPKKSLDQFLSEFNKPIEKENYVGEEYVPPKKTITKVVGEKVMTKSPSGSAAIVDHKTGQKLVHSAPIGVDGELSEVAPTPAPMAQAPVEEKKPEGPYTPMAPQAQAPVQTVQAPAPQVQPADTGSAWERLLIGATPLLTGLLTGNSMEGVQVAGNYFAGEEADRYKRAKNFNDKLAEMQAKRAMAGATDKSNKFGNTEVYNPETGKTEIWSVLNGQRYQYLGLKAADSKSPKASYQRMKDKDGNVNVYEVLPGQEPRLLGPAEEKFAPRYNFLDVADEGTTDPYDAKKIVYKNGQYEGEAGRLPSKPAEMREDGKDRRFEEAQMNGIVKDFRNKNSKFSTAQDDALNIVKAADMLNKPNPFSDEGIKTFMARSVFAEKGPLSDSDLLRLAGSGAIDEVAIRNIQRWRDGQRITNEDAKAMRQVLETVYPYIKQKAMGELEGTIRAYPDYAAKLAPRLRAYVDGNFPQLPSWSNPSRNGVAVDKSVDNTMKPQSVIQNGHIYHLNPKTGRYE